MGNYTAFRANPTRTARNTLEALALGSITVAGQYDIACVVHLFAESKIDGTQLVQFPSIPLVLAIYHNTIQKTERLRLMRLKLKLR